MMNVVVLNADYQFLNFINWRRALALVEKERVEVMKYSEKIVSTCTQAVRVPAVVRLVDLVDVIYKRRVILTKRNLFLRDDYTCAYCGKRFYNDLNSISVDHIIPKSLGGKNEWDNCVTACKACNHKKGNKSLKEAGMRLLFTPTPMNITTYIQKKLKYSEHIGYLKEIMRSLL